MSAMDTAVYWTEYVIRHKGAHHLKPVPVYMPWYRYLLLDILAAYILCIFLIRHVVFNLKRKMMERKKRSRGITMNGHASPVH